MNFWVVGVLLFWSSLAFCQVYHWVDENGVRHFSDQPPPDGRETERARTGSLSIYSPTTAPPPASRARASRPAWLPPQSSIGPEHSVSLSDFGRTAALCQHYLDRLESIRDQLSRGYREPRGNRLRAQRRELSTKYRSECT